MVRKVAAGASPHGEVQARRCTGTQHLGAHGYIRVLHQWRRRDFDAAGVEESAEIDVFAVPLVPRRLAGKQLMPADVEPCRVVRQAGSLAARSRRLFRHEAARRWMGRALGSALIGTGAVVATR